MPCKVLWLAPFARKHARRGSMSSDNRYEILYRSLNILICHFMHFLIAKNTAGYFFTCFYDFVDGIAFDKWQAPIHDE
jgi:hypothetical protein